MMNQKSNFLTAFFGLWGEGRGEFFLSVSIFFSEAHRAYIHICMYVYVCTIPTSKSIKVSDSRTFFVIKDNTITINLLWAFQKKPKTKKKKKFPSPFFFPPPPDFHCISCHNKNALPSFPSFPHLVSHLQFFFHSLISTVYLATIKIPRPLFPPSPIRSSISNFFLPLPDFHCMSCHNKNTLPSFSSFPHSKVT